MLVRPILGQHVGNNFQIERQRTVIGNTECPACFLHSFTYTKKDGFVNTNYEAISKWKKFLVPSFRVLHYVQLMPLKLINDEVDHIQSTSSRNNAMPRLKYLILVQTLVKSNIS